MTLIDPVVLAAQARVVIQTLHKQENVVVRFKSDKSGFAEDQLDDHDREAPGHFRSDTNILTLDLDTLTKGKALPTSLQRVEEFRQYPILAGVAAHESGHARWSNWDEIPKSIPNPDYDEKAVLDADGKNPTGPEEFEVSRNGKLIDMAMLLEEPRIERLAFNTFTKTWRRGMQMSASHIVMESMKTSEKTGIDAAIMMMTLVGGRTCSGTLGNTPESREGVKTIMASAEAMLTEALPDNKDAFYQCMGIINDHVFNNDHDDPIAHLEAARRILKIVHPETAEDPDSGGGSGGSGEEGEEGEEGTGMPGAGSSAALDSAQEAMEEAMSKMATADGRDAARYVDEDQKQSQQQTTSNSYGSTIYKNPQAPQLARKEKPKQKDRDLYKKALAWMERQIQPTVTSSEYGQWLPGGGARLDVRAMVRDNMAGHLATQRSDWQKVSETIKPAAPVRVAIMLDGSGSMGSLARESASIAWAAANASANLPESRSVSVVYGHEAQVTQKPGHSAPKELSVMLTNHGAHNFKSAANLVNEALWLDEDRANPDDGDPTNVLIIVVSDLLYGLSDSYGQTRGWKSESEYFMDAVNEWDSKGYNVQVVGVEKRGMDRLKLTAKTAPFTPVSHKELFN